MAASVQRTQFVEVNIWLGNTRENQREFQPEGQIGSFLVSAAKFIHPFASYGHASMRVVPKEGEEHYISFWPHLVGKGDPSIETQTMEFDVRSAPNRLPHVIFRLHDLDIPALLAKQAELKIKVARGEIQWTVSAQSEFDGTQASCASFVYEILRAGFKGEGAFYPERENPEGPRLGDYYQLTKCNLASVIPRSFDGRSLAHHFSPRSLLLRVASITEGHAVDQAATEEIMASSRVFQPEESSSCTII